MRNRFYNADAIWNGGASNPMGDRLRDLGG